MWSNSVDAISKLLARRWVAPVWAIVILAACSIPGNDLPKVDIFGVDKVAHFIMFFVLAVAWLAQIRNPNRAGVLGILSACIAYGIATELYQGWMNIGRVPDPFDALFNTAGVFAGYLFYRLIVADKTS